MFLVSKKTKWNGEKPHMQIQMPPKFRPAVHPPPSFARFCETYISSSNYSCSFYLLGLSAVDAEWPCPTCTLVNSPTTVVCSACGTQKNGTSDKQNPPASPGPAVNPNRTMQRQKSIPVESRRKRDEKQAKEQWISIVKYCKNVCVHVYIYALINIKFNVFCFILQLLSNIHVVITVTVTVTENNVLKKYPLHA